MKSIIVLLSLVLISNSCTQRVTIQTEVVNSEITAKKKQYFIVESEWRNVRCRLYQEEVRSQFRNEVIGNTYIQRCVFPRANLRQVYDIVRRIDPNLLPNLPRRNLTIFPDENESRMIDYVYKGRRHLLIRIGYDEKMTYIEIIQKRNETHSYIIYSGWDISLFGDVLYEQK